MAPVSHFLALTFFTWQIISLLLLIPDEVSAAECVDVEQGKVCGLVKSVLGRDIVHYFGVPFAKPPVGELRFKAPRAARPWDGTFKATKLAPACYQAPEDTEIWSKNMWNPNTPISEDCLYLNLWAPKNGRGLPVMVWIFGGGFFSGSPSLHLYNGGPMASVGDVVVVNINYRTNAFGFLYLGTSDAPGNVGLLDQRIALKWVHENIAAFGGDPDRVTIFGESAGSGSVSAHMISKGSQPYFRNAIMQSGTVTCSWGLINPEILVNDSYQILKQVGCNPEGPVNELVSCAQSADPSSLVDAFTGLTKFMRFPLRIHPNDGEFFERDARSSLSEGKLTTKTAIFTFMQNEGSYFLGYADDHYFAWYKDVSRFGHQDYAKIGDKVLPYYPTQLRKAVLFEYSESLKPAEAASHIVADGLFICCSLDFVDQVARSGVTTYLAGFDHIVSTNQHPKWMGAMHGFEIELVFGIPLINRSYTEEEKKLSRKLIQYWTNVAKIDAPEKDPEYWHHIKPGERNFTVFGPDSNMRYMDGFKGDKCAFWNSIHQMDKCYRQCEASGFKSQGDILVPSIYLLPVGLICFHLLTYMQITKKL